MPTFSRNLKQTLDRALASASERHHEYATLEHLLLSLIDDVDASAVLRACSVDLDLLAKNLRDYIDRELDNLVNEDADDCKPTAGFQRVVQRAIISVQSSGREDVSGANVLVALFAERESHAVYFLQEQDMTRYDAVNYISHGIAKRPGLSDATPHAARRRGRGRARRGTRRPRRREPQEGRRARGLLRQSQQKGARRPHRSADRPRTRSAAHHPGAVPAPEEQSAARRRSRRRQDRDRRRPRAQDHLRTKCPTCWRARPSLRSTWARCSPARAIAAISKSG